VSWSLCSPSWLRLYYYYYFNFVRSCVVCSVVAHSKKHTDTPLAVFSPFTPYFFIKTGVHTCVLRSTISFQVRKGIAVFLREPLPDDFIPPPPHAVSACGDVNDVDHAHGDLNGTPST